MIICFYVYIVLKNDTFKEIGYNNVQLLELFIKLEYKR